MIRQEVVPDMPHLGGVGMIRTVTGKVTLDRLTAVLPGAGGETMVKETSPVATSSSAAASGSTRMKRARKPDQGHSTLLYSNCTLSCCPGPLVLVKIGASSKRPALRYEWLAVHSLVYGLSDIFILKSSHRLLSS